MDIAACALLASSLADVACPCLEFTIEYSYRTNVHMNLWGPYIHISVSEGDLHIGWTLSLKHDNDAECTIRPFSGKNVIFQNKYKVQGGTFLGGQLLVFVTLPPPS